MHSPGVPFREGEHSVSGDEAVAFAVNSLETRYFGSLAPSLCEGSHRSSHKLGSRVQSGLACRTTHVPSTTDENLARETEKMFAVQICWGCFVAEVHSG